MQLPFFSRRDKPRPSLTADPRIEALEGRRELERTRTGWWLAALTVAAVALAVAQIAVDEAFAILLVLVAAALGVALDRWQSAVNDDERTERDLRALTSVYHESPLTLRKWLTPSFIHDSIRNLLSAALGSEPLAHGYWRQGVEPFLTESSKGFKESWRYDIDIADLEADVELTKKLSIARDGHRRLRTSVTYMQQIPNPAEVYYVAVIFEGTSLPSWFRRENFLLREVAGLPAHIVDALPPPDPAREQLPRHSTRGPVANAVDEQLAKQLLDATVSVGEEPLEASLLLADRSGIRWGFSLSDPQRAALEEGSEIRVTLKTFISREQRHFPVVIAAPTKNPVVRFSYAMTDIEQIETEVFFSAERPWDSRLCSRVPEARRVDIVTEPDDWVFTGSGCIFMWGVP